MLIRRKFSLLFVACAMIMFVGCGDDAPPPSPGKGGTPSKGTSQKTPVAPIKTAMPEFDPEARYNGKKVTEYAGGLSDLNPKIRAQALKDIHNFGVNGIPVREQVQKIATSDSDDKLRVTAFAVLHNMKDPDAIQLMRDAIRNPQAVSTNKGWIELALGAVEMVGKETLISDMTALAKDNPEHAEKLFTAGFGRAPEIRAAMAKAIMGNEKSDRTVGAIMQMLPQLGLTDDKQIDYINANRKRLPNSSIALQSLQKIGGDKAFDAAIELLNSDDKLAFFQKVGTIQGFVRSKVNPAKVIDVLAKMTAAPGRKETEQRQLVTAMQSTLTQTKKENKVDADCAKTYLAALTGFSENEDVKIRSLAVLYLASGVTSKLLEPGDGIAPVLLRLQKDDQEIVLGTAIQQLQAVMASMRGKDPGDLPKQMAETMYARDPEDKWAVAVADGVNKAFTTAIGSTAISMDAAIAAVDAQAKAHKGHPANVKTLAWFYSLATRYTKQLGDKMVGFSATIANLMLDDAVSQAEIEKYFGGNMSKLTLPAQGQAHSIESIIAFGEPLIKSGAPKLRGQWARRALGSRGLLGSTYSYVKDPEQKKEYVEFMKRMIKEASPSFRLDAINGLTFWVHRTPGGQRTAFANFTCEIGGQELKVTPAFGLGYNFGEAHAVEALAEEGALLINGRNKRIQGRRLFAIIVGLKKEYDVVFIDKQGKILVVTTLDDPAVIVPYNKKPYYLTHNTAHAALLLPKGKCKVKVGDQTPLEPEFLASW